MLSHYDTIGVTPSATYIEIRKAYRMKAKMLHSDITGSDDEEMKRLNAAYSTLKDIRKRTEYDNISSRIVNPFVAKQNPYNTQAQRTTQDIDDSLTYNNDGTWTYITEDGDPYIINEFDGTYRRKGRSENYWQITNIKYTTSNPIDIEARKANTIDRMKKILGGNHAWRCSTGRHIFSMENTFVAKSNKRYTLVFSNKNQELGRFTTLSTLHVTEGQQFKPILFVYTEENGYIKYYAYLKCLSGPARKIGKILYDLDSKAMFVKDLSFWQRLFPKDTSMYLTPEQANAKLIIPSYIKT